MKRKRLLFAAIALIAGALNINAQDWTASPAAAGSYFLYNVGEGKYLTGGNSWGTHGSLDAHGLYCTLVSNGDGFNIATGNGKYFGDNGYVDSGAAAWTFTAVDGLENTYTIYNATYGYLVAVEGSTDLGTSASAPIDRYGYWKLASREALTEAANLSEASEENPVDVTFLMSGANFVRNCDGWANNPGAKTNEKSGPWTYTISGNNFVLCGPQSQTQTNTGCEMWNNTFDLYQTVTLPNGKYYVTCDGFGSTNTVVYGNEVTAAFTKTGAVNGDNFANALLHIADYKESGKTGVIIVSDGTLKVGVKRATNSGSEWTVIDNMRIYCVGTVDLSDFIAAYEEALGRAQALQAEKMNATALEALQTALTTYGNVDRANQDALVEATSALNSAVAAAQPSVDAYISAAAAIAAAKAVKDNHNFATADAITTFAEAIAAIETPYDNNTLTTEAAAAAGLTLGVSLSGWRANANGAAVNYLENGFGLTDFEADLYINTWSTEGESDGSNFKVPFYEYWTGDGNSLGTNTWTGTLSDLPNGLYSVSALVRVRAKNGTAAADATGITIDVNGGEAVDVTEGTPVGTSQFQLATYEAEGLVKDGTLNVNFNIAADNNISWLSFKNVKYTKVRDLTPEEEFVAATTEDYAALNEAIDAYVLGFDQGEYAPYNNVEGVTALAAAKAIDQEANNAQEDVQAATAAITDATWTVNTEEVNAVYDGTFENAENNGAPAGWTMTDNTLGGSYHARAFVGDDRLAAFNDTKSAFYIRFDGTNSTRGSIYRYGETNGYTMPLKANTTYYVSADLAGWGQKDKTIRINVGGPDGFEGLYKDTKMSIRADQSYDAPIHVRFFFTTGEAGDYRISLQNPGASADNAAVISNIEIKRAPEVTIDEDKTLAVGKYATRIYPFAPQAIEGINFYSCAAVEGNTLTLVPVETPQACVPYILGNDSEDASEAISLTQTGVDIHDADTYTVGYLTGVFAEGMYAPVGSYVLQTQKGKQSFYIVDQENYVDLTPYRAYLTVPAAGVKAFNLGGDATAINTLEVLTSVAYEAIYSADGKKLNRIEKGVNILKMADGSTHKVIVK